MGSDALAGVINIITKKTTQIFREAPSLRLVLETTYTGGAWLSY